MSVTAVAFDLGGVLTYSSFDGLEAYGAELGVPAGTFSGYFRGHPMLAKLETGQITSREFFKYVCIDAEQQHGERVNIHRLAAAAAEGERLNPAMIELVTEVRTRCKTALLTNNVAEAGWRATFPFELFDAVLDSSALGIRKPDPRVYAELLSQLGAAPEDTAFVDDLPENLAPARELGIQVIQFAGVEQCRAELRRVGALA